MIPRLALGLILTISAGASLALGTLCYELLAGRVSPFLATVFGLLGLYLGLVGALLALYRLLLRGVGQREGVYRLGEGGRSAWQELRIALDAILVGLARPLLFVLPHGLRLLGAKVGRNFVMTGTVYNADLLEVGDDVIIGAGALVTAHLAQRGKGLFRRIRIGNRCTIGARSVVMPGVEVGDGAVIGAGAVVPVGTKVPPHEVWAGVPARKVGQRRDRSAAVEEPGSPRQAPQG